MHNYIVGSTGTGKSTLQNTLILEAIHRGEGLAYFDPHGHDTDDLIHKIPRKRRHDVIYFNLNKFAIQFNPIGHGLPVDNAYQVAKLIGTLWDYGGTSTPRMDSVIFNCIYPLITSGHSFFGIYLMLRSPKFRDSVLRTCDNKIVKDFWSWYGSHSQQDQLRMVESTYNKIQILMADPRFFAMFGTRDKLDLYNAVKDKILLFRLPQGELGLEKSALVGSLLLVQLHQALLARDPAVPFHVFIDEAHQFAPDPIAEMLSGIRKQNVHVTVAHQYMSQLSPVLLASLKANAVGHIFRLSRDDSDYFKELGNVIKPHELMNYQYWHMGTRQVIRQTVPLDFPTFSTAERDILTNMRMNYHLPASEENAKLLAKYL